MCCSLTWYRFDPLVQEAQDNLKDAESELMMVMDDEAPVKFVIGECYVEISMGEATAHLEASVSEVEEAISKLNEKCKECKAEMQVLKTKLYAKFGKNINLEEE